MVLSTVRSSSQRTAQKLTATIDDLGSRLREAVRSHGKLRLTLLPGVRRWSVLGAVVSVPECAQGGGVEKVSGRGGGHKGEIRGGWYEA